MPSHASFRRRARDLKFSPEEVAAIQGVEQELGYQTAPRTTHAESGGLQPIAILIGLLLLCYLIVSFVAGLFSELGIESRRAPQSPASVARAPATQAAVAPVVTTQTAESSNAEWTYAVNDATDTPIYMATGFGWVAHGEPYLALDSREGCGSDAASTWKFAYAQDSSQFDQGFVLGFVCTGPLSPTIPMDSAGLESAKGEGVDRSKDPHATDTGDPIAAGSAAGRLSITTPVPPLTMNQSERATPMLRPTTGDEVANGCEIATSRKSSRTRSLFRHIGTGLISLGRVVNFASGGVAGGLVSSFRMGLPPNRGVAMESSPRERMGDAKSNERGDCAMNVSNIFNRQEKENGQVRVPSIEVQGDELRVDDQPHEQQPQERQYRLPKTKWF